MRDKTGIYVHIPFCVQKCRYCDFLSFPSEKEVIRCYVDSLIREIRSFRQPEEMTRNNQSFCWSEETCVNKPFRQPEETRDNQSFCRSGETCVNKLFRQPEEMTGRWGNIRIEADTVFIGGGTPSILSVTDMERIFAALSDRFCFSQNAEITVECNPGTAGIEVFQAYRSIGINRISFGIQSAVDEELKKLGRIHTAAEAKEAFRLARQAGFDNINVDLMSAISGQTLDSYRMTLRAALALNPQHISAYSLIIEEGTPFYAEYGENPPVDEDTDRDMYAMTKDLLAQGGYERYEISNYAKPGFACRHNLKYWSGGDYIGFGLGASSKIGKIRYKNETDLQTYLRKTQKGDRVTQIEEVLQAEDEMAEFFILGLRKTEGVSKSEFARRFSIDVMERYGEILCQCETEGLLSFSGDRIAFTDRGLDVSNYVLCRFI